MNFNRLVNNGFKCVKMSSYNFFSASLEWFCRALWMSFSEKNQLATIVTE